MKAIVNVKNNHTYSKWNGLTYNIYLDDIDSDIINLDIQNHRIPFKLTEIIIIDLQYLMKLNYNNDDRIFNMLERYIEANNIKFNYPF